MTAPGVHGGPVPATAAPAAAAAAAASDAACLAQAQALKDAGYEALYREPAQVQAALAQMQALQLACQDADAGAQINALAAWLAGADAALRGRSAEAVATLDAAYTGLRAAGRLRDAAASQVPKLIALAMLGQGDAALACGERTRQELLAAGDEAAAGRVEINLGSMLLRQHRYAQAASRYRSATARLARLGDRRHSVMADIGLATALGWTSDDAEAARIFERAAARVRAHGLDDLQPVIDNSRGQLALRQGRHAAALRWLEAALRICEARGVPQPLAEARRDLADAYLALNLLPEALALYEQAIAASQQAQAPTEQAWATMQRGRARAGLGAATTAAQDLAAARAMFDSLGHAVGAARAASHAAALALRQQQWAQALALAEPAAAGLRAAGVHGWAAEAALTAVRARRGLGQYAQAQALAERTSAQAQAAGWDETASACLAEQGLLAWACGDEDRARVWLEQAVTAIESRRAELPADEFRSAYAGERREVFDALLALALAAPADPAATGRVLEASERGRAPALRLAAGRGETATAAGTVARRQLEWTRSAWQRALALGAQAQAVELGERCRHLEAELLERRRRARAAQDQPASPPVVTTAPRLAFSSAALQSALRADQALVSYAWSAGQLVAVVATRQRLQRFDLHTADLATCAQQLRFQIDTLRFGALAGARHADQLQARTQARLALLYRQLWAPLARAVGDAAEVIVVPSGLLHALPFAAFCDSGLADGSLADAAAGRTSPGRSAAASALLDRHALLLSPSAALWLQQRESAPPLPRRLLALGAAGPGLPHVQAELAAVAGAFEEPQLLQGPAATRQALAQALAPRAGLAQDRPDVLHLACHGQFRADSPLFSALALADGPLALHDIQSLPAPRAAVVLSACETAQSHVAPGDEMLGLARGFLLAGAPRVLATLWAVEDAATARLMAGFYRAWRTGAQPAQALRQAQLALRAEQPHPYYWAPTVLYGVN